MTDNVIKLIDWRVKLEMAARRRAGISPKVRQRLTTEVAQTGIGPAMQTLIQSATVFDLTTYFTSRGRWDMPDRPSRIGPEVATGD
jgi:hypothetical protein